MGDHDDGLAESLDRPPQEAEHLGAGDRVEVAGRLVGEDDVRPAGQRAGARHPLLLAAGELARACGPAGRARPTVLMTVSSQAWSGLRPAMSIGRVMFSIAVSVGTRLNAWNTKPIRSRRIWVSSLSPSVVRSASPMNTCARRGVVQRRQAVHERRLAGPGRAHDRGELTRAEFDGDAVEGGERPAPLKRYISDRVRHGTNGSTKSEAGIDF